MTAQEAPTFDLTELSDHQRRLLTPDNIESVLSYKQLQSLGSALGMQTVGMPKEELQAALLFAAQFIEEPTERLIAVTATRWFTDGNVPNGKDWRSGETRYVSHANLQQLLESGGTGVFSWEK